MQYIFIIGIFEALFLALLLFSKKEKRLSENVLGIYFLLFGLGICFIFIEYYNRTHDYPYPAFLFLTAPLILLHGPIIWFYVKTLTEPVFRFKLIYLLHFIPFLIMILDHCLFYYFLPPEQKIWIAKTEAFKEYTTYAVFVIAIAVSTLSYLLWCILLLIKHNKNIKNYFSRIDHIDLKWLKILFIILIIGYLFVNGMFVLDLLFQYARFDSMQFLGFVISSLAILFLGFYGLRQGHPFSSGKTQTEFVRELKKKQMNTELYKKDEEFARTLLDNMEKKKYFEDTELNIAKLSQLLKVAPDYLSNILNNQLHKNFFDFVNHFRIESFKKRIQDPSNEKLTLLAIAYDCGFNSKATFNRVFKKHTSLTPKEYKEKIDLQL